MTPGPAAEIVLPEVTVVDRKAAVMFGVLTVGLALMLILAPQEGDTTFRLKAPDDFVQLPTITVPSTRDRVGPDPGVCAVHGRGRRPLRAEEEDAALAGRSSSRWPG